MNEAEYDMKNWADRIGCLSIAGPKAEGDNTLRDLLNFSYPTKADSVPLDLSSSVIILQIADVALRIVFLLFLLCF